MEVYSNWDLPMNLGQCLTLGQLSPPSSPPEGFDYNSYPPPTISQHGHGDGRNHHSTYPAGTSLGYPKTTAATGVVTDITYGRRLLPLASGGS